MSQAITSTETGARKRLATTARWLCVAAAFSVPLPSAWLSFTTALFLLAWMASGSFRQRWLSLRAQPVALISLALFLWMGVSTLWSTAPLCASAKDWWLYRELLIIPLMASIIDCPIWSRRLLYGLLCGFTLALVASFLRWFGVLHDMGGAGKYAGFVGHTGFSILLAFAIWTCFWLWRVQPSMKWLWLGLGLLSLLNLFFINTGRTGQLTFLCLIPLLAYQRFRIKGVMIGILAASVLAGVTYLTSTTVHERIDVTISDIREFRAGETDTNDGVRMEFWQNTAKLIASHPVLGGGTGSFRPEYRAIAESEKLDGRHITPNPHNEYLMIWSQTGIVGLALLLALWGVQWHRACGLAPHMRYLTQGLLVTMIVGDMFNSFILDNLEGHFYALMTVALFHGWPREERCA